MGPQMPRMLRSDAQDNRDRLLTAARELFSEQGLDVGMREVARRAEVGPATLYRQFPTRQDLIAEAFALEMQSCRQIVLDGCADPDPWRGFVSVVRRLTALNARNRGFVDAFMSADTPESSFTLHRRELLEMLEQLGRRARMEGSLRQDFVIGDLVLILRAGRGLASVPRSDRDAAASRFATLAVDAFRG